MNPIDQRNFNKFIEAQNACYDLEHGIADANIRNAKKGQKEADSKKKSAQHQSKTTEKTIKNIEADITKKKAKKEKFEKDIKKLLNSGKDIRELQDKKEECEKKIDDLNKELSKWGKSKENYNKEHEDDLNGYNYKVARHNVKILKERKANQEDLIKKY